MDSKIETLETCIRQRQSIREFQETDVDSKIIYQCLELAQLSPSNSNIQNWRLFIATGQARDRIVKALSSAAQAGGPKIAPIPDKYKHHRSELGRELYGPQGYNIPRHDQENHAKAVLRNYEFFGAPVIAIVAQDPILAAHDTLSLGLWLQTFILALTQQGLGTCLEVSVAGYPEVLQKEFGTDLDIICGLAIGWPKPDSNINKLQIGRNHISENVTWIAK